MSFSLYASCRSLTDFFERFESFVSALDSKVRVSLGSIGETSARIVVAPGELESQKRYRVYKDEALRVGGALMTVISVEQDGRAIEFRLSDWNRGFIPLDFDRRMVQRTWLSRLAHCFELRGQMPDEGDTASGLGPDRDRAYMEAIRQFEEATASVAETNEQSVAAARAFFADATKELARQHATMRSGFETEQQERRQRFERYLAESEKMDIREHAVVRRQLLANLDNLARREGEHRPSDAVGRIRRRITLSCGMMWLVGGGLIGLGLMGQPLALSLPPTDLLPDPWANVFTPTAAWASGWMPEILFASGMLLVLVASLFWLRHLARVLKRSEVHDDASTRFRQDLLRMSWLAELYLEAADKQHVGEAMETALPQVLLERFSRSLFNGDVSLDRWAGLGDASLAADVLAADDALANNDLANDDLADDDLADDDLADDDLADVALDDDALADDASSDDMGNGESPDGSAARTTASGHEASRPVPLSSGTDGLAVGAPLGRSR